MHKMTHEEFLQALGQAGMTFDCWGYEGILNIMSEYFLDKSCTFSFDKEFSNILSERGRKIFEILESRGFYNEH